MTHPPTPAEDDLITIAETCTILGVSRWSVQRRVQDGLLTKHTSRRGRTHQVRYSRSEVLAVLADDQRAAAAPTATSSQYQHFPHGAWVKAHGVPDTWIRQSSGHTALVEWLPDGRAALDLAIQWEIHRDSMPPL
jgi:predicted DNA-binding transcriptional regulator AlpA